MKLATLAFALLCAAPAWAVNKCTGKDGTVTFQDAPCPNTAQSKETVHVHEQGTISASSSYGVSVLDLTGPPVQRFARSAAAIETLAEMSSDCKRKLQVYGALHINTLATCQAFTTRHKAWWVPATDAVSKLMEDRSWTEEHLRAVEKTTRHMTQLHENTEYILLRMQAE